MQLLFSIFIALMNELTKKRAQRPPQGPDHPHFASTLVTHVTPRTPNRIDTPGRETGKAGNWGRVFVMTDTRKGFERIIKHLPALQERHATRMIQKRKLGGNTPDMIKSFFDDLNEVKWMLVDVESNSLPALKMFILYLDYFECTSDAWKLRLITKRKFPNATIKTDEPDMVIFAPPQTDRTTLDAPFPIRRTSISH